MIVRQHQARRPAFERPLEQLAIGYSERALRPTGDQLVAEERTAPVEVGEEQRLLRQRPQTGRNAVDKSLLERNQDISWTYQPIQAGSLPDCRSRRRWNTVPSKRTIKTASVGPLFMVM